MANLISRFAFTFAVAVVLVPVAGCAGCETSGEPSKPDAATVAVDPLAASGGAAGGAGDPFGGHTRPRFRFRRDGAPAVPAESASAVAPSPPASAP